MLRRLGSVQEVIYKVSLHVFLYMFNRFLKAFDFQHLPKSFPKHLCICFVYCLYFLYCFVYPPICVFFVVCVFLHCWYYFGFVFIFFLCTPPPRADVAAWHREDGDNCGVFLQVWGEVFGRFVDAFGEFVGRCWGGGTQKIQK